MDSLESCMSVCVCVCEFVWKCRCVCISINVPDCVWGMLSVKDYNSVHMCGNVYELHVHDYVMTA